MDQRKVKKALKNEGWFKLREGRKHEIWSNGEIDEAVPRHREINERLAKSIIKKAQDNPAKK